jgi:hypothetical protein
VNKEVMQIVVIKTYYLQSLNFALYFQTRIENDAETQEYIV